MNNTQNQNDSNLQKDETQRKSPAIFMQIGLVFALLMVYIAIESKTYIDDEVVSTIPKRTLSVDDFPPETFQDDQIKQENKQPEILILDKIEIKDDDDIIKDHIIDPNAFDASKNVNIIIPDIPEQIIPEDFNPDDDVSIVLVDEAPVFPGCKGNNEELKKCFSKKVMEFVNHNFDSELGQTMGLEGIQKINVTFKVDTNGNIVSVFAKGTHKSLENEAVRVINKLPKMTPGKMNGKKIRVNYALPIKFEVK